jgi:IS1 family transposase
MGNHLPKHKQVTAISMLCEGMGIRAAERVLNVHRDTIMRLGRDVGEGYARLHNELFIGIDAKLLELDEAWSFVFKKQAHLKEDDSKEYGDQYSYIAIDADNKAIISYHFGKRNGPNTIGFALDLASRVDGQPQITSDGFSPYIKAIKAAFGSSADYAMLIKQYKNECAAEAARKYSPSELSGVERKVVSGDPVDSLINTAFVERQNLTLRMLTRRFNRLTNAHSKTLRNHAAAMDLYVGYYNLCWKHETLKKTPAMAVGVTSEPWSVEQFIDACKPRAISDEPPIRPGHTYYAEYLRRHQRGRKR